MTKIQSRIAALALLALVMLAALWALAFPIVSAHVALGDRVRGKVDQLARYQHLASSQDELQNELALLKRRNPAATYYVAGETPALASAKMQQYLKQIVQRNGGELISTQIVAADKDSDAGSSSLKVQLRGDIDATSKILYMLESGRPLLFIDDLVISARRVRGAAAGAPPSIALDLNFELTGYREEGA